MTAALLTGCRYGELAAMIVNDFNPDAGTLWVKASKDGKPRHVVLTQEGCEFVTDLTVGKPRDARLLLRSNERVWGKSEQQRPLAAACAAARIDPPTNFHGLRHITPTRAGSR